MNQKEAARLIMTNIDRVIGIQGAPSTGKSIVLQEVDALLKLNQVEVQF